MVNGCPVTATARNTYDHRLRNLVAAAGTAAVNDVMLPRSTVATWKRKGHLAVVSSALFEETDVALRAKLVRLEHRLAVMRSLLCLLLVLVRVRGARLIDERLPDGNDKTQILAAIDRATRGAPRWLVFAAIGMSASRLRRWKARSALCVLDDQVSCPKQQPSRLTFAEEQKMRVLVEANELRHFSIRALAMHARRIGALFASESTWWRTIHDKGWMRPKQRIHPESPKIGIRASRVGEILHVDVTVIRLLDGTKVFLQAVMDNFSRKILAWRVSSALEPWRTGELIKQAASELQKVVSHGTNLLADSGVENVNTDVDEALKVTGIVRILAQIEVSYSNSMVEALWRQMKHAWLFINRLDTFATVERLVAFYVEQHNSVMPHWTLKGRTSDEVFKGEAVDLPERLRAAHRDAIRARIEANRRLSCVTCEVLARAKEVSSEPGALARKDE